MQAAYASGQTSVYLAAGVAALIGGVVVLAPIRPERPAEAVSPAAAAPPAGSRAPQDRAVRASDSSTGPARVW